MFYDIFLNNYETLIIVSIGSIVIYYCYSCIKKVFNFSSNNEMNFNDDKYNFKYSYNHSQN